MQRFTEPPFNDLNNLMNREEYLATAKEVICHQRQTIHGKPENTFALISDYWSVFLSQQCGTDICLTPADVAVMMGLFKTARWQMNPDHADNMIDNIGYLALAGELHSDTARTGAGS